MKKLSGLAIQNLYFVLSFVILGSALIFTVLFLTWFGIDAEPNQTSVGIIYLGDLEEDEYASRIESEVLIWKSTAVYDIYYQNESFRVDLNLFDLDIENILDSIQLNQQNQALFTLSESNRTILRDSLKAFFTEDVIEALDFDTLIDEITHKMGRLIRRKSFALVNYLDPLLTNNEIDAYEIKNLSDDDMAIMSTIEPLIVEPYSRFSVLKALEIYDLTNDQMSMIATAILTTSLNSHFSGFDFSSYPEDPSWAVFNYNVRILRLNRYDLTFFNNLNQTFTFHITPASDNSIEVSLEGYPYLVTYKTVVRSMYTVNYPTFEIENEDLDETQEGVEIINDDGVEYYRLLIQEGIDGSVISYFRSMVRLDEEAVLVRLFEVQLEPTPKIYHIKYIETEGETDGA
ncbi:MAG: hypothetical protein PHW37_05195 [Acholeplasmataceae bacterium]|nr:hypothetical protein [Acholeplasmataceae bacterium]